MKFLRSRRKAREVCFAPTGNRPHGVWGAPRLGPLPPWIAISPWPSKGCLPLLRNAPAVPTPYRRARAVCAQTAASISPRRARVCAPRPGRGLRSSPRRAPYRRARKELLEVFALAELGHPDTHRQRQALAATGLDRRLADRRAHAFGDLATRRERGVRQHDQELLATVTPDLVGHAQLLREQRGHFAASARSPASCP